MIEADRVIPLTSNQLLVVPTPTHSGEGQQITRCPKCYVAVWSDYGTGDLVRWVKVGTLDHPELCPPGVHIYAEKKQPWLMSLNIKEDAPVFQQYYKSENVWSKDSLERMEAVKQNLKKEG